MKNEKSGRRYVRRIPLSRLGGGGSAGQANTLKLTVRGLRSGRVMLEAADGTAYSCTKERSCGALWGDVVEAQPIGGQRVAVRQLSLAIGRKIRAADICQLTVHIPLDVLDICRTEHGCHALIDVITHFRAA